MQPALYQVTKATKRAITYEWWDETNQKLQQVIAKRTKAALILELKESEILMSTPAKARKAMHERDTLSFGLDFAKLIGHAAFKL
jgi:hypothetical protein